MSPNFTKLYFTAFLFLGSFVQNLYAQSILNPADPVVTYNPKAKPAQPPYGQIGKWVRTVRVGWNSTDYKAYIYNGTAFRLKFPKSYNPTAVDGKKYPILIFFHGYGEKDSIWDNEYQLYHGADVYQTAINNGTFDGYALFMQSQGYWGTGHYQNIIDIVNYMIANNKVDPFQIMINGLSAGGQGVWEILNSYPSYFCAAMPLSWSSSLYEQASVVNTVKFCPMWETQGDLDGNPAPYTTYQVRDAILNAGGNYKLTEYPNAAHDTWDPAWNDLDFWPFFKRAYSSNPWTLGGKTQFFPGDTIKAIIGLNPGYSAYQWRKDGVEISGATSNTLNVTALGVYDARVQRNGLWSEWSRVPVTIKMATYTVLPATIQAEAYNSMVGVLAEGTTDSAAGQDLAYIDNGDWMDYSVKVPTSGNYIVSCRVASQFADAKFDIRAADRSVLGTINVPKTGGWQIWKTVSDTIKLAAGYQTLRILSTGASNWNFNWLSIKYLNADVVPVPVPTPAPSPVPTPATGYTTVPGTVQAESFANMTGVISETTTDAGSGQDVGYIDTNDWMDYNINATSAGTYTLSLRLASPGSNGQIQIKSAAGTILGTLSVPNSGGWQNWQTATTTVTLPAGNQTLRIFALSGGWNINWIGFATGGTVAVAPAVNYVSLPATIQAEKYDKMSGVMSESTSDAGGGQDVGYIDANDWMDYNVNPTISGAYTFSIRVASPISNARIELRTSTGTVLASIVPPNTGGWQNWQTASVTVNLTAGNQTLRLFAATGGWNLNWISFSNSTGLAGIQANTSLRTPLNEISQPAFNVYPIPSRDALTMNVSNEYTGKMVVQVVGMNGIVQKEYTFYKNNSGNNEVRLNIGDLQRGEYFLKAQMANWNKSVKIVKL